MDKYFPLGKAYGDSFCNRVEETAWLVKKLLGCKHSLLIAPRRYGKSSLAEKAIAQSSLPCVKLNFHLATSEKEIADMILNSTTKLIGQAIGPVEKLISLIKKSVSHLSPSLSFGGDIAKLELTPQKDINHALVITESLLLLDKLLIERNKKAVIFFDEFQEITKITRDTAIEGAFRTAAQELQNLSIIFSGSIRSLLLSMFEDEKRPLYKLCRKLKLERISRDDYHKHLNMISELTWKAALPEETLNQIMTLSNRHPYYVNYLCDILWEDSEELPDVHAVDRAWNKVLEEEWSDALREISVLPVNQRKLLKYIANNNISGAGSQEMIKAIDLAGSSINSAINALIEKDYIETSQGYYQIINPLLSTVFTATSNN